MLEHFLPYFFIALGLTLVIAYLNRGAASKTFTNDNGLYSLRMHKLYAITSIICICLGLFITAMIIITGAPMFIAVLIMCIFLGTGIPLFLLYKNHNLKFDNSIIQTNGFLGKPQTIQWVDIQNISFNHFSGLITITDSKGQKIKIHQHVVGLATFIKTMGEKTNWSAEQLKLPIKT